MLIAYLAIGYVPFWSWDPLSYPSTSVNQFSDVPSLQKKKKEKRELGGGRFSQFIK